MTVTGAAHEIGILSEIDPSVGKTARKARSAVGWREWEEWNVLVGWRKLTVVILPHRPFTRNKLPPPLLLTGEVIVHWLAHKRTNYLHSGYKRGVRMCDGVTGYKRSELVEKDCTLCSFVQC